MNLPPIWRNSSSPKSPLGAIYRDVSEVVGAGVDLLRQRYAGRAVFLAAEEEADREGCVSGDEMLAHVRAALADKHSAAV